MLSQIRKKLSHKAVDWWKFFPHRVKWPHELVLAGQTKDQVTYNQLSPIQWMVGFCRTIREESDMAVREYMLDYVINLLDDATDFQ